MISSWNEYLLQANQLLYVFFCRSLLLLPMSDMNSPDLISNTMQSLQVTTPPTNEKKKKKGGANKNVSVVDPKVAAHISSILAVAKGASNSPPLPVGPLSGGDCSTPLVSPPDNDDEALNESSSIEAGDKVNVLKCNNQIKELHTVIRDR